MKTLFKTTLLATAAGLLLGACGARQQTDDLDVTRVVLYQSGIAYLERSGEFRGDELTMAIRPEQINDVLTSMVVVDRNSNDPVSVSLPIDRADVTNLYDLPPELREAGGMYAVLHALRGADVTIFADGRHRGRVVGVENAGGARVTLLSNGDELSTVFVNQITRLEVENESIAMALDRALDQSQSEGDWRPIDVTIRFADDGRHDVAMAYVVPMPIWKPAYRVIVNNDDTLLLQGWAVVDNTSGEDWNDVRLSLTAGTPISFEYDIHSPIYVQRPDLTGYGIPDVASLAPPSPIQAQPTTIGGYGGGTGYAEVQSTPSRSRSGNATAPSMFDDYGADMAYAYEREEAEEMYWEPEPSVFEGGVDNFAGSSAEVEGVGSLFRFDIPGAVTVPDQSSTLVTLVNSRIDGEDALVHQPNGGSGNHPYRSLLLENSTPYPIQPAPLAIYAGATFVGEGITPTINPGEDGFVPYALDSRVQIDQRTSSNTGEVTLARIINGQVYVEQETIQGTTFTVANSLDEDMRLYVQVSRYSGYELLELTEDDVRTHPGFYMVPMELGAGVPATMTVEQSTRSVTQLDVFSPRFIEVVGAYISNPEARPDVAEALAPVQANISRYTDIDLSLREQRRLRSDIQVRVGELRASIATLGEGERNADLRDTLVERLGEQEVLLDGVAAEIVVLTEEQSALRVQITEALRQVTLERE